MEVQRKPGSSYRNPIRHGKWRIYVSDCPYADLWSYVHEDYDGTEDGGDNRCGFAKTVDECKAEIDEYEDEHADA